MVLSKQLENMELNLELNLLPRRNSKENSQQTAYAEIVSKFQNQNRHQQRNVNVAFPRVADELKNQFSVANINPTASPSSLCDVILIIGKNKIYVHKLVMVMASKVFQKMFETDMKEANNKEVELKDIKLETLKTLLKYIYTDQIDDKDVTVAVLAASDMYEVLGLRQICIQKLSQKLSDENVAGVWVVAYQHSIKSLTHDAVVYMARRWNVLSTNKDIGNLIQEYPNLLITISDLLSTLLNTNQYPYNQHPYKLEGSRSRSRDRGSRRRRSPSYRSMSRSRSRSESPPRRGRGGGGGGRSDPAQDLNEMKRYYHTTAAISQQ
jgi:hypothetical protein